MMNELVKQSRKSNAYNHKQIPPLDRQNEADETTQTITAGKYAKTTARGFCLVHCFVSCPPFEYAILSLL